MSDALLNRTAVQEVERLAKSVATKMEIGGKTYSTVPLYDPRTKEPEPEPLVVRTLQGFADMVNGDEDSFYRDERGIFVHVESPAKVKLQTGIFGDKNQRVNLLMAMPVTETAGFGYFLDQETFVISLLSHFEQTGDRDKVMAFVSSLAGEVVANVDDDGVSQVATTKRGVVRVTTEQVPSPCRLTPFESFPEIEQVERPFILRLRGGGDGHPPKVALFPCDGERWRLTAISRIKEWLKQEIQHSTAKIYG